MASADHDDPRPAPPDRGMAQLGEDTTGFGRVEMRTVWHTLVRPAQVLEAYMTAGPSGGGLYARPLRLYLALCGILMAMLFVMGGTSEMMSGVPVDLTPLIERSGKSRDAFLNDCDGWSSLVLVPITCAFYAVFAAPLLRWWDVDRLGWRKGFRATFHYLNAFTIPLMPIGWLAYMPEFAGPTTVIMLVLSFVAFLRTGKGRWYRSPIAGVVKAGVITVVGYVGGALAYLPIAAIGLAGALWGG